MKKFLLIAATVLALGAAAGGAQANLITNGSFETGNTTGWTVDAGSSGYGLNPFGTAYGSGMDGTYWAWLAGYEIGRSFSQTVTGLSAGTSYALTFIMASEYVNSDSINVSVNGGSTFSLFTAPPDTGGFWHNWVAKELDFIAGGTSATIEFSSFGLNKSGFDVGIDKVALDPLEPIPEPATLLLVGTGLVGFAALRRRRNAKA